MRLDAGFLAALAALSVTNPRGAARQVLALAGAPGLGFLATAAVACLSVIYAVLLGKLAPPLGNPMMMELLRQPFVMAGFQLAGMVFFAGIVTGIGRLFGGQGRLGPALVLLAWMNFLTLVAQIALLVVMLAIPSLPVVFALLLIAAALWILASFIAELHGFSGTFPTLGALIGSLLLLATLIGASAPPM